MIVTCPSCATRFNVPDAALEPDGRQVKCSRCEHRWFQMITDEMLTSAPPVAAPPPAATGKAEPAPPPATEPPPAAAPEPPVEDEPDAAPEPVAEAEPGPEAAPAAPPPEDLAQSPMLAALSEPEPADEPEPAATLTTDEPETPESAAPALAIDDEPPLRAQTYNVASATPSRRSAVPAWSALVASLVLLAAVLWFARDQLITAWPQAASIYAAVNIATGPPPPGEGLRIDVISTRSDTIDGVTHLVLEGEVVNTSNEVRDVPDLVAVLVDGEQAELQSWRFGVETRRLGPGESAAFRTSLPEPDASAEDLNTRFAAPTEP